MNTEDSAGEGVDLRDLGWDDAWARSFADLNAPHLCPARVAFEGKHAYRAVSQRGEVHAIVSGRMLHARESNSQLPKVGDWVAVTREKLENQCRIEFCLPRRTHLSRKIAGRQVREQVMVANVNSVFIVQGLDDTFNLKRLERFVVQVTSGGAAPVLVLNKSDLKNDVAERSECARKAFPEIPIVISSACQKTGITELRDFIPPFQTVVFIGVSGAGKSSLINCLMNEQLLETTEVRTEDSKGRHTTAWREMRLLKGGGLVIDTPGVREVHLWDAAEATDEGFTDVAALTVGCRFGNCSHTVEPGCAVLEAVRAGVVSPERHASYLKLRTEANLQAEIALRGKRSDGRRR